MSKRFEVTFQRAVTGVETIQAHVLADTADQIMDKIRQQDFDRCLVVNKDLEYFYEAEPTKVELI